MNDPEWKRLQDFVNDMLGLKGTKGSGNVHGDGDGMDNTFINECKFRKSASPSVPINEWNKLVKEAETHGKIPIFTVVRPHDLSYNFYSFMRTQDLGKVLIPVTQNIDEYNTIRTVLQRVIEDLLLSGSLRRLSLREKEKLEILANNLLETYLK